MMSQSNVQIVSAILSVDSVHQSCADVPTWYKAKPQWAFTTVVSVSERTVSCGLKSWRPLGDPHCPWLTSRIFRCRKSEKPEERW